MGKTYGTVLQCSIPYSTVGPTSSPTIWTHATVELLDVVFRCPSLEELHTSTKKKSFRVSGTGNSINKPNPRPSVLKKKNAAKKIASNSDDSGQGAPSSTTHSRPKRATCIVARVASQPSAAESSHGTRRVARFGRSASGQPSSKVRHTIR